MVPEFTLLGKSINYYWLFIVVTFIVGVIFLMFYGKRDSLKIFNRQERILFILLFYIVSFTSANFFGALELHLLDLSRFGTSDSTLWERYLLFNGQGRWYGSLFSLLILFIIFLPFLKQQKILRILDIAMLVSCLGLITGKIGCFLDGHPGCHGIPTDAPWGVTYAFGTASLICPAHPVQMYDAIFHSFLFLALILLDRKKLNWGVIGFIFLVTTSLYNVGVEYIRTSDILIYGLSFAQVTYLSIILLSLIFSLNYSLLSRNIFSIQ